MKGAHRTTDRQRLFKRTALSMAVAIVSSGAFTSPGFTADCNATGNSLVCSNVLYYYNGSTPLSNYDDISVTTSASGKPQPLAGFGVYMASGGMTSLNLNDITITTSNSVADAFRSNSEAIYFRAKNLTINTAGNSADGINVASDFNNDRDSLVYVTDSANISVKDGVAVRANNFRNAGANSIIILAGKNTLSVFGTGAASNSSDSKGYAVYAGNRNSDTNGLGLADIFAGKNHNTLGRSYVFIGDDATISTSTSTGHAVYANKGGVIQLGDGADISTSGKDAYAIYAATEQQGTYTDNVRAGHVYLAGGAKLRAANSEDVIQAKGEGSIITSQSMVVPDISDTHDRLDRLNINSTDLTDTTGVFDIEGNINAINGGTVALNMSDSSKFVGSSSVDDQSTVDLNINGDRSLWEMTKNSVLSSLTLNQATLRYSADGVTGSDASTFKTLTVNGDYTGNGGTLALNTVLGGDDSLTDKLIVKGNTSGSTNVAINNIGGAGEQTVEGIEIVEVGGNSEGTFAKAGRIVAGGYDYDVVKKASNWYLTSHLTPVEPEEPTEVPIDPPDPVDPPDTPDPVNPPVDPVDPPAPPATGVNQYRPEFGSYLANNYAANTLFITRLHDRLGETQYTDMLTGERKVTSMWMRHEGGHTRFTDGSGQLKTQANRYVLQIGGDIAQWTSDGLDRWHLGVMAGYANQKSRTHNTHNGYSSRGQVDGYSVGLYATWYANEENKTGTYLDSWVLYNWFDNKVTGKHLASEKYDSDGITASVEGGYTFLVGESERATYWIQPKAQAIWMDVQADTHRERNGTVVKDKTDGNLMTRLGVRAYLKGHSAVDDGKGREFQPFVEANWIHNTRNQTVQMGTIRNDISGTKNIGELKAGVEGQINPRLQVWGNVAQQIGDNGYSDTAAMLGIKYSF